MHADTAFGLVLLHLADSHQASPSRDQSDQHATSTPLLAGVSVFLLAKVTATQSTDSAPAASYWVAVEMYSSRSAMDCGVRPSSRPSGITDWPWLCILVMFERGITSCLP